MSSFLGEPARFGEVAFDRKAGGVTAIVVKGFLLSLVTFGIYRFWYITALRRFFWSRTVVAGSAGEYVGRGRELLLGFLVALAVLIPVYLALFALAFAYPPLAALSGPLSFVVLFLLGQYAIFRGRRYRASRTLWRGIRLGQDGSAAAYVARAAGWWLLTGLTLGLAFPWMRAGLERYRINHTLVGESRMASTARAGSVLGPWLLFYVIGLGPVLLSVLAFLIANDFSVPGDLFIPKPSGKPGEFTFNPAYDGTRVASYGTAVAVTAAVFLPLSLLLIPYYRAREARAFLNAASLGPARLTSSLRARQFYWPYIVYMLSLIGYVIVVGLVIAGAAAIAAAVGQGQAIGQESGTSPMHFVLGIGLVAAYLGSLLVFAVLYVRVITVRLWHAVAATTGIENAQALDTLLASSRRVGSGLNEGLADALDVGGALEIGF